MKAQDEPKTSSNEPTARLWTPLFILLIFMCFLTFTAGQGFNSGTTVYIVETGGTAAWAGILAAIFSASAAVSRLVAGPLSDRCGRVIVALISYLVFIAGTALCCFGNSHPAIFTMARILQGMGFSAATTAVQTAAADILPKERLGEGVGYTGLGQSLALAVGPSVGLTLVTFDPPEILFVGLGTVLFVVAILLIFVRYEKNPEQLPLTSGYRQKWEERKAREAAGETVVKKRLVGKLWEPNALVGAVPLLFTGMASGCSIYFMGLYGTSLGIENPGFYYTCAAITSVAIRSCSKLFMDKYPPLRIFACCVACGVVCFIILQFVEDCHALLFVAGALFGCFTAVQMPLNISIAMKNTPAERWGTANSTVGLANDIAIGTSSIVWGFVNDVFGFKTTFICVIGCLLVGLFAAKKMYAKLPDDIR